MIVHGGMRNQDHGGDRRRSAVVRPDAGSAHHHRAHHHRAGEAPLLVERDANGPSGQLEEMH